MSFSLDFFLGSFCVLEFCWKWWCDFLNWTALRRLGVKGIEIRKPEQLQSVNSLIIPGGESTTMAKLAEYHNLVILFFPEPQFHLLHLLCLYLKFHVFLSLSDCFMFWLQNFVGNSISRMFLGLFYRGFLIKTRQPSDIYIYIKLHKIFIWNLLDKQLHSHWMAVLFLFLMFFGGLILSLSYVCSFLLYANLLKWENLFGEHVQASFFWQTKPLVRVEFSLSLCIFYHMLHSMA